MPTTAVLATTLQGAYFDPLATKAHYQVQFWDFSGSGLGPGSLIAEFENVKNLGYADYANDVPEAFCTLDQQDAKAALLDSYIGKCHMVILRNGEVVWTGFLLDTDEQVKDVVFYGYGYAAALFWATTGWNSSWTSEDAGAIARDVWYSAQTGIGNSNLQFVATGVIEAPATDSTLGTAWTLPLYKAFFKRALFVLQELAAAGASDTGNAVIFEITHSLTPQFNFWRDRQVQRDTLWQFGGIVNYFSRLRSQTWHRNDIRGVGNGPHNQILQDTQADSSEYGTWGHRLEPVYYSWVRDADELSRVDKIRLKKAEAVDSQLWLGFKPNSIVPPGVRNANLQIGDLVPVKISRGITNIDQNMLLTGYQMKWNGVERFSALIQTP